MIQNPTARKQCWRALTLLDRIIEMKKTTSRVSLQLLALFSLCLHACATVPRKPPAEPVVSPYPFDDCAVLRSPLKNRPTTYRRVHKGQEILLCCRPCVRAFELNPDLITSNVQTRIAEQSSAPVDPE